MHLARRDLACQGDEPSISDQIGDHDGHRRRRSMAMDVPQWTRVTQKATALLDIHRSPESASVRPERIHGAAPISTLGPALSHQCPYPTCLLVEWSAKRHLRTCNLMR